ncbi:MAG: hypothetical protein IV112_20420 [Methyloversatilis discipulorum]|uniref:hypothetical protein n=1 Tax=Methyloversatilis discipulorum TaxID=1119528 RepID=UPI0026EA894A|nr:hypothetical protein [Methyloversatilis discipulorum]MBT9519053.1 hypothetical protein [Methyloversatilis discipulorum]
MPTRYRLVPEGENVDIDLALLRRALPSIIIFDEESGHVYATLDSQESEDSFTQILIDRELDRLFFLTYVRLRAEMCRRTVTASLKIRYRIQGSLSTRVHPQIWSDQITLQLRLWALAADINDGYSKVLLLYQIIELSYPDTHDKSSYPPYENSRRAPHPRTEAKLLRHLIAHAGDAKKETSAYLQFLGLPPVLSNLVHPNWVEKITERIEIVERQAREVLQSAL